MSGPKFSRPYFQLNSVAHWKASFSVCSTAKLETRPGNKATSVVTCIIDVIRLPIIVILSKSGKGRHVICARCHAHSRSAWAETLQRMASLYNGKHSKGHNSNSKVWITNLFFKAHIPFCVPIQKLWPESFPCFQSLDFKLSFFFLLSV